MRATAALGAAVSLPALAEGFPQRTSLSELDPAEQREVVRNLKAMQGPPLPPRERLEGGRAWLAGKPVEAGRWLDLPGGPRLRVVPVARPRGVLLDLHGGGWCLGTALSDEVRLEELGRASGLTTVSVDYRLAPEHPFPAGPDDCLKAARWLIEGCRRQFGTDRLLLRGASAGAHLAASTLVSLGAQAAKFAGVVLYYGVYDLAGTPSRLAATDADHPDLSPSSMEEYTRWFLGGEADRRRAELSPLYAELRGMPPALMLVGTQDILLDDTLFLAARWAAAGSPAELVVYPEAPHGFDGYPTAMARDAQQRELDFLKTSGRRPLPTRAS